MAVENRNIIIGAAGFYISNDTNESADGLPGRPTLTGTGPLAASTELAADYRNIGFTTDGVEVSYEPDYGDVEVDQWLDSAVIFQQGMRVTVNTTLMEATLENLLVVWGQRAGDDPNELNLGEAGLGDFPLERSLVFIGPSPRTPAGGGAGVTRRERVYYVERAIQTETTAHALRRAETTSLPASFRALPVPLPDDPSRSRYGTVTDRALVAAPVTP